MDRLYNELFREFYTILFQCDIESYSLSNTETHHEWSDRMALIARLHAKAVLASLEEEV